MGKVLDRNDELTISCHLAALFTVGAFFIELFLMVSILSVPRSF